MSQDVTTSVAPVTDLSFTNAQIYLGIGDSPNRGRVFVVGTPEPHGLRAGAQLTVRKSDNSETLVSVLSAPAPTAHEFYILPVGDQAPPLSDGQIIQIYEAPVASVPQSIVFREFTEFTTNNYTAFWLSLDLGSALGAKVYLDGQLVVTANLGEQDTATANRSRRPVPALARLSARSIGARGRHRRPPARQKATCIAVELFSRPSPGRTSASTPGSRPTSPWM